jgi:Fe-S cluster biogenesis protein NfuA
VVVVGGGSVVDGATVVVVECGFGTVVGGGRCLGAVVGTVAGTVVVVVLVVDVVDVEVVEVDVVVELVVVVAFGACFGCVVVVVVARKSVVEGFGIRVPEIGPPWATPNEQSPANASRPTQPRRARARFRFARSSIPLFIDSDMPDMSVLQPAIVASFRRHRVDRLPAVPRDE